ncbi:hypothetical protein BGW41_004451 [Actinomortierella wolfii]|nr:hypothetical protein BGW41_004451 [Actinomortierella wolfii]
MTLAHAKNSIAFTSQAAIRLDTMTDYWHQFHLWHREESPLVDTEYDLDRERQRIMQQQQQQQHQNCEAVPHYHHHHHHPTHPVYSPAVKRHQASSQGMPVVARTSSGQPMAPSSPSPRRRTSLQSPRIPMAANNAHSRELPRSTQDLSRLLESVFDDATAHAQMSHSRTHHSSSDCGRDRDLDNSDDDDDGPLCMRTPVARRLAAHSAKLSSPSGPTMNVLKSAAPMSPKEMTLSQPPTLPLSSLPRSSISVRSLHASAAVTQSTTPSPAPAPKVTSRPKFFVSDDSEDEDEDDFEDEDNEEDILVANYRKLSETIAHGRQHRQPQPQHRIPSLRVDKAGNEGDDECEDDDIVDDMATLTSASKKQQQQQQHLNPNNHPLVAERRQSLLSDLLMAEKMANLAAKKSNDECSMANASPMPARFTTLKQVPYNNNNNHYNYHFGSRTMAHHGSNQSSRCHSAANSDGESQLYPTLVVNGATPGCRKETPIIMMQDGRRVTCPSSSSSSEEEEDTHRHNNRHRSPLMRTRKSLFNKLDELVKATEAEEERMALEADLAKQRISHEKDMKDILEESEDCFGPHAIMQNEREKKDADFGVVATSQSPRSAAPVTSQSPQGQQQQQPQAQEARSSAPGIGGWSRSSVQYQIQSLYGMSASTVQRALSTATATLAEYGYLGSRSSSTTPEATQPATPATQKEHQRQSSHQSSLSPPPKQQPQGRLSAAANLLQKHLSSH